MLKLAVPLRLTFASHAFGACIKKPQHTKNYFYPSLANQTTLIRTFLAPKLPQTQPFSLERYNGHLRWPLRVSFQKLNLHSMAYLYANLIMQTPCIEGEK
jgi:hypothetical protein